MLNFSVQKFEEMLSESNKEIEGLKLELTVLNLSIRQLSQKRDNKEKDIETQEKKSEAIRKALILVHGVPSKVSKMRDQLLRKMWRVGRKDIMVAESENLKVEIESLKLELQKVCSHPFVYDEPGYEGSPSCDYENRNPGVRYCVVCGFSERTHKSRETGAFGLQREYLFEILVFDSKRIIQDQPWTSEGRKRIDIWIPLGVALKPFEDSVAKILNSE